MSDGYAELRIETLCDTVRDLLAEIGDPALVCSTDGCAMHAVWECASDGYATGACDTHRRGREGEWHLAPHADALRSLDGVQL